MAKHWFFWFFWLFSMVFWFFFGLHWFFAVLSASALPECSTVYTFGQLHCQNAVHSALVVEKRRMYCALALRLSKSAECIAFCHCSCQKMPNVLRFDTAVVEKCRMYWVPSLGCRGTFGFQNPLFLHYNLKFNGFLAWAALEPLGFKTYYVSIAFLFENRGVCSLGCPGAASGLQNPLLLGCFCI